MNTEFLLSQKTKQGVMTWCIVWTISISQFVQLLVMGVFAYRNPDPVDAYYVPLTEEMFGTIEGASVYGLEPVDMHSRFVFWLRWGFWNLIAGVMIAFCILICKPSGFGPAMKIFMALIMSLVCGLMCSIQVWTIIGAVWRFNKAGRTASGEFLIVPEDHDERESWKIEVEENGY